MKLPNRIIIDLEDNTVVLEHHTSVLVSEEVPKLHYCQNSSGEGIDISINISIPVGLINKKGVEEDELARVIDEASSNLYEGQLKLNLDDSLARFVKGLANEQSFEDEPQENDDEQELDYHVIQNLFDEASNPPYKDDKMQEFINYCIQGHEDEIFEYKKALFLDALKDPNMSNKKRVWLKKNKINLLNSKCKLDKND